MLYHLTLINSQGFMQEHSLDLPVNDTVQYNEFIALPAVKELLLMHPTMQIQDVTPDGMSDTFSIEETMQRQLHNMGIKKSRKENGAPLYEEDIEEEQEE